MKNYLVVYMSHHGTTRKIAKQIQTKIGIENVAIVDLERDSIENINNYKTILIGGSIYMGSLQKKIKQFCESNKNVLLNKNVGLFVCFMNKQNGMKEFEGAYPEYLRNKAVAKGLFGGELILKDLNFFERLIVRYVSGVKEDISDLDQKAIDEFIAAVKEKQINELPTQVI